MAIKKSRDQLVRVFAEYIDGKASRADLALAASHYDKVTRVKLPPVMRQLLDEMVQR